MSEAALDPYAVLGVAHDVSDIELRRAYRGLVKRYHPDHNGGSAESAALFAQIQNAYDAIAHNRTSSQGTSSQGRSSQRTPPPPRTTGNAARGGASAYGGSPHVSDDPDIEDRIANLEREMAAMRAAQERRAEEQRRQEAQARLVRERARQAAETFTGGAASKEEQRRPTQEELGYYTTDDSFTKIIDDAADQLGERLRKSDAKRQFTRRLSDLFGRDT